MQSKNGGKPNGLPILHNFFIFSQSRMPFAFAEGVRLFFYFFPFFYCKVNFFMVK